MDPVWTWHVAVDHWWDPVWTQPGPGRVLMPGSRVHLLPSLIGTNICHHRRTAPQGSHTTAEAHHSGELE